MIIFIPKSGGQKVPFSYLLRWYRAPTLPAKGNIVSIVLGGKGASTAPAAGSSSSSNDFTLRSRLQRNGGQRAVRSSYYYYLYYIVLSRYSTSSQGAGRSKTAKDEIYYPSIVNP
jgi:hypothetical protein